jgi:small subunit ribosomal protein S27e
MAIKNPRDTKFLRVKCSKCKSSQVIFGKSSQKVRCVQCDAVIAEPAGGKAKIRARVEEVLN